MSSLLSQCLHTSGSTRSVQHVVSLFHTSSAVRAARGRRNNKDSASAPPPPPRPEFQRDGLPHEGRAPVVSASRAPRQFDAGGRSGRRTAGKGPLASPSAVSRQQGREGGSRDRVRSREGGAGDAGQVRGRERGGDKRGAARYGGEGEGERGARRNYDGGGGGERERERNHSPSSSFHRSVERASRENYRIAKQLDRVKFDNEHEFGGASSPRRAGASASPGTYTSTHPSNGPGTSRPWRHYDAAADAASHPEPRRDFSDFDRPLKEGAYDAPELKDEFFHPLDAVSPIADVSLSSPPSTKGKQRLAEDTTAVVGFASPPLMPGLVASLHEVLGRDARPTPIQALSIRHLLGSSSDSQPAADVPGGAPPPGWRQFLLASETGSGKSIAYLLPLLQGVKQAELAAQAQAVADSSSKPKGPQRLYNPRGLIMAPTHELARQLSVFAKGLLRADDVKLRVLCASRANVASTAARPGSGLGERSNSAYQTEGQAQEQGRAQGGHPVDVVVGTPMKLLEMVRGRGFDALDEAGALARAEEEIERDERAREEAEEEGGDQEGKKYRKVRRGRDRVVHFGKWKSGAPELGLANVEWVVVDEADVLFDPDFQETTRALLADISAARGVALPASASTLPPPSPPSPSPLPSSTATTPHPEALAYPFNLILTSATIPKALNGYLARFHPRMLRLASPRLHRLPKALQTEYVGWTGGNKFADVMRRLRQVWAEDAASSNASPTAAKAITMGKDAIAKRVPVELSKILVFCNKSAKVAEFAAYLEQNGIKSVALTSGAGGQRLRGSNGHLSGFLKDTKYTKRPWSRRDESASADNKSADSDSDDVKKHAHVMVTTSLLSRGLDFTPSVKHVFIVDEPRNTVDFIHRAGRTGRAGERGKVVIFGKMAGRGNARTKEIRRRVSVLTKA